MDSWTEEELHHYCLMFQGACGLPLVVQQNLEVVGRPSVLQPFQIVSKASHHIDWIPSQILDQAHGEHLGIIPLQPNRYVLLGPVRLNSTTEEQVLHSLRPLPPRKREEVMLYLNQLPVVSWYQVEQAVQLVSVSLGLSRPTPNHMERAEQIREGAQEALLRLQYREEEFYHLSPQFEAQLLSFVGDGNVEEVRRCLCKPLDGHFGVASFEGPLRSYKNIFIAALSSLSDRVIECGLDSEEIRTQSEAYMREVEARESLQGIFSLARSIYVEYTKKVHQARFTSYCHSIARCIAFIEGHFSEELSLQRLAEEVNLERSYLSRLFTKEVGIGVAQFLRERRLREARSLLRWTLLPIADVAIACGFTNRSHFSTVFAQSVGCSPGRFRQKGMV